MEGGIIAYQGIIVGLMADVNRYFVHLPWFTANKRAKARENAHALIELSDRLIDVFVLGWSTR